MQHSRVHITYVCHTRNVLKSLNHNGFIRCPLFLEGTTIQNRSSVAESNKLGSIQIFCMHENWGIACFVCGLYSSPLPSICFVSSSHSNESTNSFSGTSTYKHFPGAANTTVTCVQSAFRNLETSAILQVEQR